jgi:hypothetical protein
MKPVNVEEIYWAKHEVNRLLVLAFNLMVQRDNRAAAKVRNNISEIRNSIKEKYEIIL